MQCSYRNFDIENSWLHSYLYTLHLITCTQATLQAVNTVVINGKYRLNHYYMHHYTSYIPLLVVDVVTVVVGVITGGQGRLSAVTVP